MKALFAGVCSICKSGFAKGEEINYDRETKKASHGYCYNDGVPQPEALADRLGFKHYAWEELYAGIKGG